MMTDYQRVVDELRSVVQASDQTNNDSLKKLATEYAELCRQANERLRRCDEYLQKGLRSEAIHFAEAEPKLLDVLATLDFPERPQWEQLAASYSLPSPPALRLDTAVAINRAIADEQPLEHLLKRHRLLALARAPVAERLAVLRQIGQLDPGNPVWAEDVTAFERVRLRALGDEVNNALARNDTEAVFDLWNEVQSTPWLTPPPGPLVEFLGNEVARRGQARLRQSVERAAQQLCQAHGLRDEAQARPLRDEWHRAARQANLAPEDPLWLRVGPALKWLAQADQRRADEAAFEAALDGLERALAQGAAEDELDQAYAAAARYKQFPIPADVQRRFKKRVELLQKATGRRERVVLAVTFSVGALALVAFLVWVLFLRPR